MFDSTNVTIRGNDCSDNQGWGIQLHRSSNNTVINNRADNVNLDASLGCVRDQQGACDTAGILVIKGANDNSIHNNSFNNVHTIPNPGTNDATTAVINLYEVRSGQYPGNRLHIEGNIFRDVSRLFEVGSTTFPSGHTNAVQVTMARNSPNI